jgi:hypothetical protein
MEMEKYKTKQQRFEWYFIGEVLGEMFWHVVWFEVFAKAM